MNWDLFRFSIAKRLFRLVYPDYSFTEYGNEWFRGWDGLGGCFKGMRVPLDRYFMMAQLLRPTLDVPGDMVECGAYRGQSANVLLMCGDEKRLHVFDSFQGLSEPGPSERGWWRRGDFSASRLEFERAVEGFEDRVVIHAGWIPERFHEVDGLAFSFVHVDVDLAAPTGHCIDFFYPRLSEGGIMLFDDYGFKQCREARREIDKRFPWEAMVALPTGQAFVTKGKGEQGV